MDREKKMQMHYISVKVGEELFRRIAKEAADNGTAMIDVVVQALANHYGKPSLGVVPRMPHGRRPRFRKVPA